MAHDPNLIRNLLALKKRTFDIAFDLQGTDYTSLENIGSGAYGVVCCARHEPSGEKVAIKKIPNIFELTTTAKRTYREMKILRHFKHDNIISIREILQVKDPKTYEDIYVVLDLMESDLHRIIHSNQPLTEEHIRYFIYQIFRGLKYIHSASIIHRDLKPSNILVNENCLLKIGDFGMARGITESGSDLHQHKQYMTQYVATRWYRAPELIMLFDHYSEAVDLWSAGCILAEMLGRKQIFPAEDVLSQLQMIIMKLGPPPDSLLQRSQSDIVRGLVRSVKMNPGALSLSASYPRSSRKAMDLLKGLLVLDPNERLTAQQALKHLFVNKYHDPNDEPICEKFDFSFEQKSMNCEQIRQVILEEIRTCHEEKRKNSSVMNPNEVNLTQQVNQPLQFLVEPDDVFKIPNVLTESKSPSKPSDKLTVSNDVEMLSAKNSATEPNYATFPPQNSVLPRENSQIDDPAVQNQTISETCLLPSTSLEDPSANKIRPDLTVNVQTQKRNNKTISEDTKALIKAALLQSSNRRKFSDSSENPVKKAVTAQQRQKEREERRRKKSEKSKRKSKEKVGTGLSEEDKSMLERWQNMAPPKAQVATTNTTTLANNPIVSNDQNQVVAKVPPQQNFVSFPNGGMLDIAETEVSCNAASNVKNDSLVDSSGASYFRPEGAQHFSLPSSDPKIFTRVNTTIPSNPVPLVQIGANKDHGGVLLRQLQEQQLQNQRLQQHHLLQHEDSGRENVAPVAQPVQPKLEFLSPGKNVPAWSGANALQQSSPATQQSFLQTHLLLEQLNTISGQPTRNFQAQLEKFQHQLQQKQQEQHQKQQQDLQLPRDQNQFFQHQQQEARRHTPSPPNQNPNSFAQSQPQPELNLPQQQLQQQLAQQNLLQQQQPVQQMVTNPMIVTNPAIVLNDSVNAPPIVVPTSSANQNDQSHAHHTSRDPLIGHFHPAPPIPVICIDSDDDQKGNGTENNRPETNSASSKMNELDTLADMTKQFSRSQVEDIFPPNLMSTPKGCGEGYGVGLDLDEILHEWITKTSDVTPGSAPLSASMLTDWLQVAGNVDPRDMADLQRELDLSPMVTAD